MTAIITSALLILFVHQPEDMHQHPIVNVIPVKDLKECRAAYEQIKPAFEKEFKGAVLYASCIGLPDTSEVNSKARREHYIPVGGTLGAQKEEEGSQ